MCLDLSVAFHIQDIGSHFLRIHDFLLSMPKFNHTCVSNTQKENFLLQKYLQPGTALILLGFGLVK